MMAHNNGFIVAIKFNGKVLRESYSSRISTVYLPYHSEYSLLLKNQKSMRALAKVEIDGMDALGGQELIINAHSSVDLERFILDGNLDNGRRFKFVPLSDSQVQDPNSPTNGDIVVTFTEEVNYYPNVVWYNWPDYSQKPSRNDWSNNVLNYSNIVGSSRSAKRKLSSRRVSNLTASLGSIPVAQSAADKGATVEGGHSGQRFSLGTFGDRGATSIIRVQLRAQKEAVYVSDTRNKYCPSCGKRNKYSANYCTKCGVRL